MASVGQPGGVRDARYIYVVEHVACGAGKNLCSRHVGALQNSEATRRDTKMRPYKLQGPTGAPGSFIGERHGVRGRFLSKARVLAAQVFGLLLVAALGLAIVQSASGVEHVYIDVVVKPGDTLWGIAERVSDGQRDLRAVVDQIREINGLKSVVLRPGQTLKVPCYR